MRSLFCKARCFETGALALAPPFLAPQGVGMVGQVLVDVRHLLLLHQPPLPLCKDQPLSMPNHPRRPGNRGSRQRIRANGRVTEYVKHGIYRVGYRLVSTKHTYNPFAPLSASKGKSRSASTKPHRRQSSSLTPCCQPSSVT
jgi:hypothetical protein